MPFGRFLVMDGGWLLCLYECMLYCCLVSYKVCRCLFLNPVRGLGSPQLLLASMVICSLWCLKTLHISFFTASTCSGVIVHVASP